MGKVFIMSGISGSGKSTYARKLLEAWSSGYGKIVSADDYFMVDGKYQFDASKLSLAHGKCFRDFIATICMPGYEMVVVDNTNLSTHEVSPYILGAQAYGWEPEIITFRCKTVAEAASLCERNTNGVNAMSLMSQVRRLESRELMPWWKNTDIPVEV